MADYESVLESAGGTLITIDGATHFTFGDGAFRSDDTERFGTINPYRSAEIVRAVSLAFLNKHVRQETVDLDDVLSAFDEVTVLTSDSGP